VAETGDTRLPNGVAPLSYSIALNIDPTSESGFEGRASIRVRLDRPMRQIRLHGRDFTEVQVFEGKQAGVAALGPSGGMTDPRSDARDDRRLRAQKRTPRAPDADMVPQARGRQHACSLLDFLANSARRLKR